MNLPNEQKRFSERLQAALTSAHYLANSPTVLAREFNMRFEGRPVTVHAARKWLVGEAIPTQEKLSVLAQWLGVSAAWLRFGGPDPGAAPADAGQAKSGLDSADVKLISDLQYLDEHDRKVAREFFRMLVQMSREK